MLPPGGHAFPVPAVRPLGAPELRRLRCPLVPASDRCVLGGRKKPEVGPLLGFQWMRCLPLEALFNHGLSSLCPQPLQITRALFSPKSVKAACVDTASPSPAPSEPVQAEWPSSQPAAPQLAGWGCLWRRLLCAGMPYGPQAADLLASHPLAPEGRLSEDSGGCLPPRLSLSP